MKIAKINGSKAGICLSMPAKMFYYPGAEYFARIVVGNVEGDKEFALKRLKKLAAQHGCRLIINGRFE